MTTATEEATSINMPLLEKVLDLIEEKPWKWKQSTWVDGTSLTEQQIKDYEAGKYDICGTKACVAGWAMIYSQDYRPHLTGSGHNRYIDSILDVETGKTIDQLARERDEDINTFYVREGARVLGLTQRQGTHIFLHMEYDREAPKTFTDKVRAYLGLPTKNGAKIEVHEHSAGRSVGVLEAAPGETWDPEGSEDED